MKTLGDTLSSILCTYPADTTENRSKRALMILVTSMVNVFMRPRDQDGPGDVPELQERADVDGLRCLRTGKSWVRVTNVEGLYSYYIGALHKETWCYFRKWNIDRGYFILSVLAFGYIAECVLHVDNCDWLTFGTVKQESIVIGPNSGHSIFIR